LKFGVCVPIHGGLPFGHPLEYLRRVLAVVEGSTIETVWVEDHFWLPDNEITASEGMPKIDEPLEAWTTLAAMATITSRVKLGTEVTPMTLRHPGVLAKLASNVDVLSKGRLILGAGAGWNRPEFVSQGITFERKEDRFEQTREALEVVKLLWTSEDVHYDGKYYKLRGANLAPKPFSKPHPPIWLGGFSERILALTAKYGDGWINATNASPRDVEAEKSRLHQLLRDRGRKSDDITVAVPLMAIIRRSDDEAKNVANSYVERGQFDKTLRFFAETMKYGLVGSPNLCVERINAYEQIGVDHIILDVRPPSNALPTLELFCREVAPVFSRN
jgi:probable F420-dependent oxidoreductase